jgi:Protein of unknown function (DUF4435)
MAFTRTVSGIANYNKFFNSDIIIFTEGKLVSEKNNNALILDCEFYIKILSVFLPEKRIKIKSVGNKPAALDYAKKILETNAKNSFVFVDRDYEGLFSSTIDNPIIILTNGYSWENDLWSFDLAKEIIKDLTIDNEAANKKLELMLPRMFKRAHYLSMLDAISQLDGKAILNKKSATCGVSLDEKTNHLISSSEISRISKKFKEADISISFLNEAIDKSLSLPTYKIIQGHFWFTLMFHGIRSIYVKLTGDKHLSKQLMQNLALSKLKSNPVKILGDAFDYYSEAVNNKIIPNLV